MGELLRVTDLTKYYGNGTAISKALNGISFSVEEGEFTAIMGASGSGKSTLLNIIATIDRPSSGEVILEGNNLSNQKEKDLAIFRRDRLGFIFQDYNLLDTLTAEENIVLPLNLKKYSPKKIDNLLRETVKPFEIQEQLGKFPKEMSGGQQQRVACARALITKPAIILADEPTGALDSANSKSLMKTLCMMNEEMKSTILMVTHDAVVGSYASRVLFLKDGKIWNELYRGTKSRQMMYQEILNTMAVLGGEADVY